MMKLGENYDLKENFESLIMIHWRKKANQNCSEN